LNLGAIAPRELQVRAGAELLWQGVVGPRAAWIEVPMKSRDEGEFRVEVSCSAPPQREHNDPGARDLGFAVYGVEVR
jgi:hypothetical protein